MSKTPDEIKKGLECCARVGCCHTCPYDEECHSSHDDACPMHMDALALIKQLEAELEDMTARYKIADDCAKKKGEMNEKLYAELTAVKAERAELLDLCEQFGQCVICEHTDKGTNESPCCDCWYCNGDATGSRWQWRGVQKEDDDD